MDELLYFIKDVDYLGIDDLKVASIKFLSSNLHTLRAIEAYNLSDLWNSIQLKNRSKKVILKKFEMLCQTDEFFKMSVDSIKDIFSSSDALIYCTEKMLKGILRWAVANLTVRKSQLEEIFDLIQFGYADSNMLTRVTAKLQTKSIQHK